jgi:hypothetical protein
MKQRFVHETKNFTPPAGQLCAFGEILCDLRE